MSEVIYEVNLSVEIGASSDFAAWLAPHIEEMVQIEGFTGARWWVAEPLPASEAAPGAVSWVVQYTVESRAALERYFTEHAAKMRGDGLQRFGGRFSASRRVLSPYTAV